MNGWTAALLGVILAVNPAAVAATWSRPARLGDDRRLPALGIGAAVLVLAALLSGPLLDLLDVTIPTYRLGAATVLGLTGGRWLVGPQPNGPDSWPDGSAGLGIAALPLVTPAPVLVAVSAAADGGVVAGLVAIAIAIGATAAATMLARQSAGDSWALQALVRFIGAAALLVAVFMGLDAARTV